MQRLFTLILVSLMLSGCAILNDIFGNDLPQTNEPAETVPDEPPTLTLLLDEPVAMDLGTYCWTSAEVGLCVDMIPPIYAAEQHIAVSGESLTLEFADTPPSSVSAYVHPGSNLMTRIADISLDATINDGTVTIPLTDQLEGDYVLVVFAQWQGDAPTGDASYTLPITIGAN